MTNKRNIISKYGPIFLLYLVVSFFIFLKLFIYKGAILGGDWALPVTQNEIDNNFLSYLYTWTDIGNIFGTRPVAQVSIIFAALLKLFSYIGLQGDISLKIILLLVFTLAASNMNLLLRYFKIKPIIALIGGLLYITMPVFFNYSLIGWLFVLLSMAILPLFVYLFLKSIDTGKIIYALLSAIFMSLAMLQSQTIVWYPLVLISIVLAKIISKDKIFVSLKMLLIVALSFLLFNIYWIPELLIFPDRDLINNDVISSTVSIGTSARLSAVNILRLWGGLYNYQFETSYPPAINFVSFIIPLLATIGIYLKRKDHRVIYLTFLFVAPFIISLLNRDLLATIPFAAIIRDVARFVVLSTFSSIILVSFVLDYLFNNFRKKYLPILLTVILIFLFFNISSFWLGKLYGDGKYNYDIRFRTKTLPTEYIELENMLQKENDQKKALFLPLGGMLSSRNDLRYSGEFQEMSDYFANYSHIAGVIGYSDKGSGISEGVTKEINSAISSGDAEYFKKIIARVNINYIIYRRDIKNFSSDLFNNSQKIENFLTTLATDGTANIYFDKGNILALNINDSIPLFGLSNSLVEINSLTEKVAQNLISEEAASLLTKEDQNLIKNFYHMDNDMTQNSILTVTEQNQDYSHFVNQGLNNKIYQFVSLQKLNDIFLVKKWNILQRNANTKKDLSKKEQELIKIIAEAKLNNVRDHYVTYLDNKSEKNRIYFRLNGSVQEASIRINDRQYILQNHSDKNNLSYLDDIILEHGLNFIDSNQAEPIYIFDNVVQEKEKPLPTIETKKINPTKYKIKISNINGDFVFVFNENFNNYWDICDRESLFCHRVIGQNSHFVSNGYANGWIISLSDLEKSNLLIKNSDGSYSAELYVDFWLQRFYVIGAAVSFFSLGVILLILILYRRKQK